MLTPDFGTGNNLFKMALNGEVFYMKEFRIVDMASLKFGPSPSGFISKAETMLKVLRSYIQSTVWRIKPPRRPQMEKLSTLIVFVSLKQSILI